jgi:hypothetical protein
VLVQVPHTAAFQPTIHGLWMAFTADADEPTVEVEARGGTGRTYRLPGGTSNTLTLRGGTGRTVRIN